MCGIVGYIGTKKAVPVLIKGLLSLEYRGYDSAGLAVLNPSSNYKCKEEKFSKILSDSNNELRILKEKGRVHNLEENPELKDLIGSVGIAHTRWATHGVPSKLNAHPHLDNSKQFAVVHNGIIENYSKLKEKLISNGYTLYSQTDTEVIPNLIHFYYSKLVNDFRKDSPIDSSTIVLHAVSMALKELKGSYAIELISPLFPDEIIVAKKDSPLVIGIGKDENFIASDIPAILSSTSKFYFLEDKEMAVVKKDCIKFYNTDLIDSSIDSTSLASSELNKEIKDIEWDAVSSEKDGYEDYMLKEIYEQPKAIRETIGTSLSSSKVDLPLGKINFSDFNKIYIVACGTAMHAGLASKYTFEKYCKIQTEVDMASEFRYREPLIDKHTLCIFISQSGETADTIAALKLAKSSGCTTIAIVNVIGSSITRIADYTLYTHAGPEIAVASTKAYTCQVTLLNILAIYIFERLSMQNCSNIDKEIGNKNISDLDEKICNKKIIDLDLDEEVNNKKIMDLNLSEEINNLKEEIISLPNKLKELLDNTETIKNFASKEYNKKDMFFIGRGTDYAVSMEGSLKLKEISYIHSEAYAAGELKHGPIALIENGVSVIGIATSSITASKTLSNLEEVITRGANVLLITNQAISNSKINDMIKIPDCSSMISPILSVIPLQLLAYYIAKNKKLDVDKPRNLAKSVTVE